MLIPALLDGHIGEYGPIGKLLAENISTLEM